MGNDLSSTAPTQTTTTTERRWKTSLGFNPASSLGCRDELTNNANQSQNHHVCYDTGSKHIKPIGRSKSMPFVESSSSTGQNAELLLSNPQKEEMQFFSSPLTEEDEWRNTADIVIIPADQMLVDETAEGNIFPTSRRQGVYFGSAMLSKMTNPRATECTKQHISILGALGNALRASFHLKKADSTNELSADEECFDLKPSEINALHLQEAESKSAVVSSSNLTKQETRQVLEKLLQKRFTGRQEPAVGDGVTASANFIQTLPSGSFVIFGDEPGNKTVGPHSADGMTAGSTSHHLSGSNAIKIAPFCSKLQAGWRCVKYSTKGRPQHRTLVLDKSLTSFKWKGLSFKRFRIADLVSVSTDCPLTAIEDSHYQKSLSLTFSHRLMVLTCSSVEERNELVAGFSALIALKKA